MEGAPHTAKRTIDVPLGCSSPRYIKERGEEVAGQEEVRQGGSPTRTPLLVGFALPLFSFLRRGKRGKEREEEKERGARPLP